MSPTQVLLALPGVLAVARFETCGTQIWGSEACHFTAFKQVTRDVILYSLLTVLAVAGFETGNTYACGN